MRRLLLATCAAVPLLAGAAPAREPGLWATINLCDPSFKPSSMGVRVAVPQHHHWRQWIRIRVQWFDDAAKTWKPLGMSSGWKLVGHGHRDVQGGTTFVFQPPSPGHRIVLRGIADVQWRKGKAVKRRVRGLPTESGHAEPSNVRLERSDATCEIRR